MSAAAHKRAGLVCVLLAVVFSIYSARLVHLQVAKHNEYGTLADEKTGKRIVERAERGIITDRNGEALAVNVPIYAVAVDGKLVTETKADRAKLAGIIARHLDLPVEKVAERIASERPYVVVQRGVDAIRVAALKEELSAERIRGVMYESEPRRFYPNEERLSHVLGFLNHNGDGVQGVEMMMQPYLRGEDGFVTTERDRTGREIVAYRGAERPAKDGMTVELTIDMRLQQIVEAQLDEAYRRLNPNMITAVFVRPRTGEVLAMATRPAFNPNHPGEAKVETTKNRAIIEMVEPGSTFKIVVIAAALEQKVVSPQSIYHCENGNFPYAGKILRDVHGYGSLSVHDILVKSSNIGCAKIAMHLGADTFHEYIRRFGFGERTGIGLPGEIPGLVRPRHSWTPLSITRVPMGHEVAVTPLQIVMSMSAIANGGNMMLPQIVRAVRDESGSEVVSFSPQVVRRVVSEETAAQVAASLADVVGEHGTAPQAIIPGYPPAGKTGTAQRVHPKGGYTPGKYVVSFAGYFPVNDPEVAGIVLVDDARTPGTRNYGGLVAAPIFSRIGGEMARELALVPTATKGDGPTIALVPLGAKMN
jgi:cell division protein FtsI (penicillin-binding protein 3)/stage V sporulation protein D (sporulation-specific penicillin-binding protein)